MVISITVQVQIHYPGGPDHLDGHWVRYHPTDEEVAAAGGCWWTAHSASVNTYDLGTELRDSAQGAWGSVDEMAARCDALLLCGWSNGAILAFEYATTKPNKVVGLVLFSGLPAAVQEQPS